MDLAGALVTVLVNAFPEILKAASDGLAKLTATISNTAWTDMATALQQGPGNFLTRTPPELSYNLGGVSDLYNQWSPAFLGIGSFTLVCGAISALGREYFAWSWTPGEMASRVIIGLIFGLNAPRLYALAINLNNRVLDAIVTVALPAIPTPTMDPITASIIVGIWVILGFRLIVRMGYRLVYFDLLLVVGPLALAVMALPGGESYARFWIKSFVGLLIGQDLVAICLRLSTAIGGPLGGTFAGLAIGMAVLLLAYDVATIFADIKGGGIMGLVRNSAMAARVVTRAI